MAISTETKTRYTDVVNALGNSGASLTIDWQAGLVATTTLTANCTFTFTNAAAGQTLTLFLTQDGTGSRTVTWPTISWPGGTTPTLTATAAKTDIISIFYNGTTFFGFTGGLNY